CAGYASALRSRSRGLQEAPGHQGPAGGPRRCVVPGGSHAQRALALCDNDGVWLWCVCVRIVWQETWGTPLHCVEFCRGVKDTMPRHGESGASSSSRAPDFLLSFAGHLRYTYALIASPIPMRSPAPCRAHGGSAMTFEEILDQAIAMLQRRGRLTYGALKRQFQLDDAYLEDLKNELIK